MNDPDPPLRVAVVGPCASGKSTLVKALTAAGYEARHPAQEHSYVADMWQRLTKPDVLVYLDLSYEASRARRPYHDIGQDGLATQHERLRHAREHCDLYVDTSAMLPKAVAERVLMFLRELQSQPETS